MSYFTLIVTVISLHINEKKKLRLAASVPQHKVLSGNGNFVSPRFYDLPPIHLLMLSRHEEKDRVFGKEFLNQIQQKYKVFGMKSVQEFEINSHKDFFKGYNQ